MVTALLGQTTEERTNIWKQFDPSVQSSPLSGAPIFPKPFDVVASFVNTIGVPLTKCSVTIHIPSVPGGKSAPIPDIAKGATWYSKLPGMVADPKSPKGFAQLITVELTCAEMGVTRGQFVFHGSQPEAPVSEKEDQIKKDFDSDSNDDGDTEDPPPVKQV